MYLPHIVTQSVNFIFQGQISLKLKLTLASCRLVKTARAKRDPALDPRFRTRLDSGLLKPWYLESGHISLQDHAPFIRL